MHKDVLISGVTPDEGRIIDGIEDLARPTMSDFAEFGQQRAYPGFQTFESSPAIICFASLVIGAANDQVLSVAAAVFKAHVVIGIERVPIERVLDAVSLNRHRHRICSVGG